MDFWRDFHGPNAAYVLELYERYRQDPDSVDAATRAYFAHWTPPVDRAPPISALTLDKIVGVIHLTQAIRTYGHLAAQLDPLGRGSTGDPSLEPAFHGVTEEDLHSLPAGLIGGPVTEGSRTAFEVVQILRTIYTSGIGYDYGQIRVPEERDWLRDAAESGRFRPPNDPIDQEALLERLTQIEAFEQFLHRVFPGKTRFSLEGLDMLVPILDEVIGGAAESGIRNVMIGMAHRGRLNVLAHVLNTPYSLILAEFQDPMRGRNFTIREDLSWTGDVTYHMGARRALKEGRPINVVVCMPPNPSHVESANPVVEGMARAAGTRVNQAGPGRYDPAAALPILIHGDAAFTGQGVVAETLNLSRLPGYHTGGTIHLIANNQLGYTTDPKESRSTLYASDPAKGFEIPIVHVNADDPEACIEVARLAFAYRRIFRKDFLIDLIGYRRYGHNEGDEPRFTHSLMYAVIDNHPTVRERWAETLLKRGRVTGDRTALLTQRRMQELQRVLESLHPEADLAQRQPEAPPRGIARRVTTAVPAQRLRDAHQALLQVPQGFTLHPKIERAMQRRRNVLDNLDQPSIDWAAAEQLAFASILEDGIAIRLTGEDVERGTFSQRHAVFHDMKTGDTYTPLQALPQATAAFDVFNSPLTENAAIGYEYGYNLQAPDHLTIWEAQYGDFVNGAQMVIDEFVASARAKWGQTPSLVLLLPHGYEGQGPDHSSARVERFLELAAEISIRVANCTTAAQYFHLLRRQAVLLRTDPLPLVVLTPKSLLRHPLAGASLRDLSEGGWQPVIDDATARQRSGAVRRLILCSGKLYTDLVTSELRAHTSAVAIVRMEQLYPFPADDLQAIPVAYPGLEEVTWVQEEPENMGAWTYVQPHLHEWLKGRWPLRYIGRPPNSSPAEGSAAWHAAHQKLLIEHAYDLTAKAVQDLIISSEKT
ncbi:MAG: 2-oxoglutarate dehydrogenase E1 component [Candidatus Methylomirabilota bacterium]|nr:MAG: 2-oxoglutarate dehydrogenase E1 component [candidate division NC10 bacterium]